MEGKRQTRAYHVRFRHSTCPTAAVTPEYYKKFEFFFEPQQIWLLSTINLSQSTMTAPMWKNALKEEDINVTSSPETSPPSSHPLLNPKAGRDPSNSLD